MALGDRPVLCRLEKGDAVVTSLAWCGAYPFAAPHVIAARNDAEPTGPSLSALTLTQGMGPYFRYVRLRGATKPPMINEADCPYSRAD